MSPPGGLRDPFEGIGKPEPLKENLYGFWSRRIDDTQRLVCCVDDQALVVIACRYHDAWHRHTWLGAISVRRRRGPAVVVS